MKVVVLTTSYPSAEHPVAGTFVRTSVELAHELGHEVDVVSPDTFAHFGIAYGGGIANNLRRAPWKLVLVPAFLTSFARAARAASRDADLVHAHWIPSALAARATGKPYLLQVWGTDVELARRMPHLVRPLVTGARVVVAASDFLAAAARSLGGRDVRVIPTPVPLPARVVEPEDPPHVLYVGRLSEEKGIREFAAATEGLRRVVVGDGPLRATVPDAQGFVPPAELGAWYDRAAVVCVPSRREGYGMTAREALAHGRPVVTTGVGGLAGVGSVVVPPHDVPALRAAIVELLEDPSLRRRLGEEARVRAESARPEVVAAALEAAYGDVRSPAGAS